MGIVNMKVNDKKGMLSHCFSALAHMPLVSQPESLDNITDEWFQEQRDIIEKRIQVIKRSLPGYAIIHQVKELNERIEFLRKFTADVISERAKQNQEDKSVIAPEIMNNHSFIEEDRQQRYEDFVDGLLEKRKRNEEIARQTECFKQMVNSLKKNGIV